MFRPDTPGDYSAGTFTLLIDGTDVGLGRVVGVTLVEQTTIVGDTTLSAGEFLLAHEGSNKNIIRFQPGTLGDDDHRHREYPGGRVLTSISVRTSMPLN